MPYIGSVDFHCHLQTNDMSCNPISGGGKRLEAMCFPDGKNEMFLTFSVSLVFTWSCQQLF